MSHPNPGNHRAMAEIIAKRLFGPTAEAVMVQNSDCSTPHPCIAVENTRVGQSFTDSPEGWLTALYSAVRHANKRDTTEEKK